MGSEAGTFMGGERARRLIGGVRPESLSWERGRGSSCEGEEGTFMRWVKQGAYQERAVR